MNTKEKVLEFSILWRYRNDVVDMSLLPLCLPHRRAPVTAVQSRTLGLFQADVNGMGEIFWLGSGNFRCNFSSGILRQILVILQRKITLFRELYWTNGNFTQAFHCPFCAFFFLLNFIINNLMISMHMTILLPQSNRTIYTYLLFS